MQRKLPQGSGSFSVQVPKCLISLFLR